MSNVLVVAGLGGVGWAPVGMVTVVQGQLLQDSDGWKMGFL